MAWAGCSRWWRTLAACRGRFNLNACHKARRNSDLLDTALVGRGDLSPSALLNRHGHLVGAWGHFEQKAWFTGSRLSITGGEFAPASGSSICHPANEDQKDSVFLCRAHLAVR